jgi:hypothetical protein
MFLPMFSIEGLRIDALRPLGPLNLKLAAEKPTP